MKKLIYCILMGLLLWPGVSLHLHAQNNPFKIHDSIYVEYREMHKVLDSPEVVEKAEALAAKARTLGDKKGECVALTLPVTYYFHGKDSLKLVKSVQRLQKVSRENGYMRYHYFASIDYIYWLLNHNHSLKALNMTKRMQLQADKDKDDYGTYSCLKAYGYIYFARGDYQRAIQYFEEALKFQQTYLPEQDPSLGYGRLTKMYRQTKQFDKAIQYAEKGLQVARLHSNRKAVMLEKCLTLFEMGREDEFMAYYAVLQEEMAKTGKVSHNLLRILDAYKYIIQGDYAAAKKSAGGYYQLQCLIAERSGDYKSAYEYSQKQAELSDSVVRLIQTSDLAELTVQLGNERMKRKAQTLEAENIALNLANTRLQLEQSKAETELEKTNAENNALALKNRTLELERANAKNQRQQEALREQQLLSHNRFITFSTLTASLMVYIGILIFYLRRRKQMVAQLTKKNRELAEAREQAEASNRMKTQFIHNMSHEIRTPLNAIVGFSQLLATPDSGFSEEEKNEYSHIILHNSELLTTLVNDILDMSSLESEKCTVHIAPCRCNEACRTALNAVRGRLTDGVELHFHTEVPDDYTLDTDEQRLKQVLIHLLTNAAKFTSAGEILLGCSLTERPGKVVFSVADTGPGVSPDKVDIIFNRFTKGDLFKQGAGLGLAICRRVAEVLHGEVLYDRSYTQGARFLFILPAAKEKEQTA